MKQHEDLGDVTQFDEDGPLPLECASCEEEIQGARYRRHRGAVLCDACEAQWNEAAYERSLESFYGGSSPQTVAEQSQQALAEKRRER